MVTRINDILVRFIPPQNWWQGPKWELLEDYQSANKEVIAKAGFISDGASIPIIFRLLFIPTGRYFGAAIIHDFVLYNNCEQPANKETWTRANKEFKAELKSLEIMRWRVCFLMAGVTIWKYTRCYAINPLLRMIK